MKITQQDIEAIEIAWDHFQTDLEHGADCEIFDEHAAKVRNLHAKMKRAFKLQKPSKNTQPVMAGIQS